VNTWADAFGDFRRFAARADHPQKREKIPLMFQHLL
jgi:hypothetical protein